ncbi:hypothetical protein L3Q82_020943, partial [Scortum barcoo]
MSASLPDELNTFYARFESTSPAVEVQKAQEDHCPPVISRADVCRTLKRINTRKAPGPDGIPGRALKVCADQLAEVFADIFNMSLLQSVVPTCFKETIIVPVPKKTKILSLNDYRPVAAVALTSTIMKCFERPLLYSLFTHDCVATHSSNTIIKFADDTTVIGLITTGDDETAYREEVRGGGRERNTPPSPSINGTTVERVTASELQAAEAQHGLKDVTLLQVLQVHHREYPDWLHHLPGTAAAAALNRKALQRVVKAAQHITKTELPSMEDLYTQ